MPTPSEIRGNAAAVNAAADEIRRAEARYRTEVSAAASWWQGEAGKAFADSYKEIQADINRLLSKMDGLESSLKGLAGDVQRADDERRRKLEEERRRAQEQEQRRREEEARKSAGRR
ncbi:MULTISPECIES: WXG100 family type VII secretion target [Paenibacillus]|uniref:WXG100 family type VII secretion target n=1 Tax=Paenibacillus TaxID=44249 RepID=UPI00038F839C|nr:MULTISPECIES: WXG100 family type VII secretion target [Paenibacillus]KKC49197.1 hypothetical protein VE23_22290 [Paenibacillus sp. D9]CDN45686.1 hypothetical protein BN871_IL_00050 [Paenibacillus sp. P22]